MHITAIYMKTLCLQTLAQPKSLCKNKGKKTKITQKSVHFGQISSISCICRRDLRKSGISGNA